MREPGRLRSRGKGKLADPAPALSHRQRRIVAFIRRYHAANRFPPTLAEIGEAVGLASKNSVHFHIETLVRLGVLTKDPRKPRTIVVKEEVA